MDLVHEAIVLACKSLKSDEQCIVLAWNVVELEPDLLDFPVDVLKRVRVMTCGSPSDVIELMHLLNNRKIERIIVLPGGSKLALALFEEFCEILKIPLNHLPL